MTNAHTRGDTGATFQLMPGVYDIVVEDTEDAGRPRVSLAGITIEPGQDGRAGGGVRRRDTQSEGDAQRESFLGLLPGVSGGEGKDRKPVTNAHTRGDTGATFQLMPGVYDIVVEDTEDAGRPRVSPCGDSDRAGKDGRSGGRVYGRDAQSEGDAQRESLLGLLPGVSRGRRKRAQTGDERAHRGDTGATFQLMPGVYDIEVENTEDAGRPRVSLAGITIEPGKTVDRVAEFSGGTLKVKATRNGKAFPAYCQVFPAGEGKDRKPVTNGHTRGEDGATFQLMPGVYDVVVENPEDAGRPRVSFTGITIESGKTVERVAEYTGGTLVVKAMRNGKAFSAYCQVFSRGRGEGSKAGDERKHPDAAGIAFKLPPGTYDLLVEDKGAARKEGNQGNGRRARRGPDPWRLRSRAGRE